MIKFYWKKSKKYMFDWFQYLFKLGWKWAMPTSCFSLTYDKVIGILKSFMNSYSIFAVPLKSSSWTEWPTLWSTVSLNFPCIWAIVNSLSNLSFSAVTKIFGIRMLRKHCDKPLNHPSQYFSVSLRSIFHT